MSQVDGHATVPAADIGDARTGKVLRQPAKSAPIGDDLAVAFVKQAVDPHAATKVEGVAPTVGCLFA